MPPSNPLTDQLANISPVFIVGLVVALTLIRAALVKIKDPWARTISETCDTVNFVAVLAFLLIRPFAAQAFFIPSESMEQTLLVKDRLIVNKFSYRIWEPTRGDVVVFEAPLVATDGEPNVDFIKRLIGTPGDTIQVKAAQIIVDGEPIDANGFSNSTVHDYLRERMGLIDEPIKFYSDYVLVNGKRKVTKKEIGQLLGRSSAIIEIVPGQVILNGKSLVEPYTNEDPDYDFGSYEDPSKPLKLGENELFMMGDNRNHSKDSHVWGPLERKQVVGHAVVLFWPPSRVGKIR
ncbi:MAG: signal peptidase I [Armatimonadetes bacterium]|nr:signal peptidase I [Armatimonadota bacterium]